MVTLLFVIVALGSLANSMEVRDHDNQLHKVSASLRRLLTGASGSSAGFKRDFVGEEGMFEEGMLPAGFRPTAADVNGEAFDRLDFVGEEGMLSAGFRPTAADVDPDTLDTFDRLDFVGEEGMLPAGFRPANGLVFEEADDVDVDAFDDFGNRNAISHGWVGDDPEDIAAEDPNFDFGFPGMHYAFPGMHDGFPGMHYAFQMTAETLIDPTVDPSAYPTIDPSIDPTLDPIVDPTFAPTLTPTRDPTLNPSTDPTTDPTIDPLIEPTADPTIDPTLTPTSKKFHWILLRSDVECGNNENEVNLGTFGDVAACAEACRNRDGCTNFIYGKGEKAGRCWDEAITEGDCTIWEDDQYDFYGLPGTETVVNLPGF